MIIDEGFTSSRSLRREDTLEAMDLLFGRTLDKSSQSALHALQVFGRGPIRVEKAALIAEHL